MQVLRPEAICWIGGSSQNASSLPLMLRPSVYGRHRCPTAGFSLQIIFAALILTKRVRWGGPAGRRDGACAKQAALQVEGWVLRNSTTNSTPRHARGAPPLTLRCMPPT